MQHPLDRFPQRGTRQVLHPFDPGFGSPASLDQSCSFSFVVQCNLTNYRYRTRGGFLHGITTLFTTQ